MPPAPDKGGMAPRPNLPELTLRTRFAHAGRAERPVLRSWPALHKGTTLPTVNRPESREVLGQRMPVQPERAR
eukprot:10703959-Alexandrium_andersonii.AAC.1